MRENIVVEGKLGRGIVFFGHAVWGVAVSFKVSEHRFLLVEADVVRM